MKKSLGSTLVFILIFLHVGLSASSYKWSLDTPKKEVYVNEMLYIKYICEFSDRGELFSIVMKPKYDADKYALSLMKKNDTFIDGKRISTYEYLLKAKVDGKLALKFDANMKKTTLESIVYSSGSRDDDRGEEEFKEEVVILPVPSVNIASSGSDVVGEFSLEVKKDLAKVNAYEPYHLDVKISGSGNLDAIKAISFKIEGVKIFTQKPLIKLKHTKNGATGEWSQKFAFVSEKDFTIPFVAVQYFDLKSKNLKSLEIQSTNIKVTQVYKKEELLDKVEEDSSFNFDFVYYILTFLAGYLVAKINFKKEKINSKDAIFIQKVEAIKSLDSLNMLLILENERKFSKILLELDSNQSISLTEARKKVLKLIQN